MATSQKQFREYQAGRRVEELIGWLRRELRTTHRTDHVDPIIDHVEWLLQNHCGNTMQVQSWARDVKALRDKVDIRRIRHGGDLQPVPPTPTRPTLRVVK